MRNINFLNKVSESISTKVSFSNSHKLLIGALALIFVAGMASPAFALTIDDFDTGSSLLSANNVTTTDTVTNDPATTTIGGVRIVDVTWNAGLGGNIMAQSNDPADIMSYSSDFGIDGKFELTYMGAGGGGLLGIDLTLGGAADRIVVDMISADRPGTLEIIVYDTTTDTCDELVAVPVNLNPHKLNFLFVNFDGTCDLTDADKIKVIFIGTDDGDYAIDLIGVPQTRIGGTVGSMDTATLLVAGAQANMGLWSLALVGAVAAGAVITYKLKSNKTKQ